MRIAKTNYANAKCIRQNTPLFGFIPIYGLQSPVYDRKENNICQNIMDLHSKLIHYVFIQVTRHRVTFYYALLYFIF